MPRDKPDVSVILPSALATRGLAALKLLARRRALFLSCRVSSGYALSLYLSVCHLALSLSILYIYICVCVRQISQPAVITQQYCQRYI